MTPYQNVMLYWADESPPDSVISVLHEWERVCPTWHIMLYSRQKAYDYLKHHFGTEISKLFSCCAIPAMQSDFFRVFWAISEGGVYCDLTFAPKTEPLFFSDEKPLTLVRWWHGRLVNGVFYAAKGCKELKLVAYEILAAVSLKEEKSIWLATGPGVWIRALGQVETAEISIVTHEKLFETYLRPSGYDSSTRGTNQHWAVKEKLLDIYSG